MGDLEKLSPTQEIVELILGQDCGEMEYSEYAALSTVINMSLSSPLSTMEIRDRELLSSPGKAS